jgi:ppGpp synthetase/RelA/SpoT-type nucleotidyltranferase
MSAAGEPAKTDSDAQKPDFGNYASWLAKTHQVKLDREKNRYTTAALTIERSIRDSDFWRTFEAERQAIDDTYYADTRYRLFAFTDLELFRKPWQSFMDKTYRKNVLLNPNWPGAPDTGWLLPENWFEQIHDIVRTTLVVKYLDGVQNLTQALEEIAFRRDVDFEFNLEARDEGYYAAHAYASVQVPIPTDNWTVATKNVQFEIQITTQLQEVIRRLTHQEYETRRKSEPEPNTKWQWDFRAPAFTPNYLGHILHYMEGMIMEVRDREDTKK